MTISTPRSYSTCPEFSMKWTGRRLVTDSGTKCAWVIHESKAVQIHVYNNRRCLGCLVALKICTNQVRLFADDTAAYETITKPTDSQHLQADLDIPQVWEHEWDMDFTLSRCQVIHVTRSRSSLPHLKRTP